MSGKSWGEGIAGIEWLEASDAAKISYNAQEKLTPTSISSKGIYPAPDINSAEAERPGTTYREMQVHGSGQQARPDPQSQHTIPTPPSFRPQGHVYPQPPSVCLSSLSLNTENTSLVKS